MVKVEYNIYFNIRRFVSEKKEFLEVRNFMIFQFYDFTIKGKEVLSKGELFRRFTREVSFFHKRVALVINLWNDMIPTDDKEISIQTCYCLIVLREKIGEKT